MVGVASQAGDAYSLQKKHKVHVKILSYSKHGLTCLQNKQFWSSLSLEIVLFVIEMVGRVFLTLLVRKIQLSSQIYTQDNTNIIFSGSHSSVILYM